MSEGGNNLHGPFRPHRLPDRAGVDPEEMKRRGEEFFKKMQIGKT